MAWKGPRPIGEMMSGGQRWNKAARWIPDIDKGYRIRVNAVREELDVDEQARAHGRLDQPPSDDRTLDEPQLDICNRIFSGILLLNQFLAEQLGLALARGREAVPTPIDGAQYTARMDNAVSDVFSEREAQVRDLRFRDMSMQKELRYFRSRNKLNRQASYKESTLLVVGIVLGLMVLESFFNGALFKDVVSGGLAMGAVIAMMISALNIALGVFAGLYGWRNLSHVETKRKAIGTIVTVACHGAALAWNLAIAQFRDVAELAASDPRYDFNFSELTQSTVTRIHDHGLFSFASFIAWALLILGLIVHFIAAKEGWDDFADRYPDYKKIDKRARQAKEDFDDALNGLRAEARDAAKEVVQAAEIEEAEAKDKANDLASFHDLAVQREKEIRDSEDEWVSGGTLLLKVYRDINVEVRDAEPPPYFENYPSAADYRNRRYQKSGVNINELDRYLLATEKSLSAISALRAEAEAVVRANAETVRKLNGTINEVLARLAAKVAATKDEATREARSTLAEESAET